MIKLPVTLPGRTLEFLETGAVLDTATQAIAGDWLAESDDTAEQNRLIYTDTTGAPTVIRAHYAFNENNQLTISLDPTDGQVTAAASATFNGRIEIDDQHDVIYHIVAAAGQPPVHAVVVYGDLRFDGPSALAIDLTGGGTTEIVSRAVSPLRPDKNTSDSGMRDLLVFQAETQNDYGDSLETAEADIRLPGQWKLWPEGISFECAGSGDLAHPNLVLSLKGKCKAVAAGLEFRLDDGAPSALFVVEGAHTFDSGSATWSVAVGYSQLADQTRRLTAKAGGKFTYKTTSGNTLTLSGALSYDSAGGGAGTLALEIDAQYQFAGGQFTFNAVAKTANGVRQYSLQLGGEIKVKNGKLLFNVAFDSSGALGIEINYQGSDADFLKNFNVSIKRDASGKVVKVGFNFTLKVSFVNGKQVVKKAA